MILKVARLSSAFFVLLICPQSMAASPVQRLNLTQDKSSTSVPFDSANDLIIVGVTINGKGPFRFLLDTGASHFVMTPDLARTVGIKVKSNAGAIDAGGKETVSVGLAEVSKVQIGDFILRNQSFFVTSFPASYPFQGFLGAELFKRFIVHINHQRSSLTLTIPKDFHYRGDGVAIPIKLQDESIPQVEAEVDGIAGWFKLDTGYNGSLALFGKFIDERDLLTKYAPPQSGSGGQTLAGEVGKSPLTQIRTFKLDKLVLHDISTALFLEKEGSNSFFAGAIGTGIMKRFNIILDYSGQRVIFEEIGASR
jgi:predicted aspartyl protease